METFPEGSVPSASEVSASESEATSSTDGEETTSKPTGFPHKTRSRNRAAGSGNVGKGGFDFTRSLQEIQRYVSSLESELTEAKEKLRRVSENSRRSRRNGRSENSLSSEELVKELESLKRYNGQLEDRVDELHHQLTEFAADQEEIASSLRAGSDDAITDAREQYRIMLGVKLRQEFEEFQAVEREPEDEVFREHYRILLKSVFETLAECGVDLHHAEKTVAE